MYNSSRQTWLVNCHINGFILFSEAFRIIATVVSNKVRLTWDYPIFSCLPAGRRLCSKQVILARFGGGIIGSGWLHQFLSKVGFSSFSSDSVVSCSSSTNPYNWKLNCSEVVLAILREDYHKECHCTVSLSQSTQANQVIHDFSVSRAQL